MATMRQAQLSSDTGRRACWLPTDRGAKVGDQITLKNSEDSERLWTILSLGSPVEQALLHTDWRVGGI